MDELLTVGIIGWLNNSAAMQAPEPWCNLVKKKCYFAVGELLEMQRQRKRKWGLIIIPATILVKFLR